MRVRHLAERGGQPQRQRVKCECVTWQNAGVSDSCSGQKIVVKCESALPGRARGSATAAAGRKSLAAGMPPAATAGAAGATAAAAGAGAAAGAETAAGACPK
jgi:hypothetical protein